MFTIALTGNPNCGKTTLLNSMTGMRATTGNWPGVTVEKRQGELRRSFGRLRMVDLPGLYSLAAHSMEERITRDYLLTECPDLILNVIDAATLERSLYLTLQLMELGLPMLIVLNVPRRGGGHSGIPDVQALHRLTGIPVVAVNALGGSPDALYRGIRTVLTKKTVPTRPAFSREVEAALHAIEAALLHSKAVSSALVPHFATRLFDGAPLPTERMRLSVQEQRRIAALCEGFGGAKERSQLLAQERYRIARELARGSAPAPSREREALSHKIDRIATGRIAAFPIFLALMLLMLGTAFSGPGVAAGALLEQLLFGVLAPALKVLLLRLGAHPWLLSLLLDGILAGVGTVLVFLPQLAVLFLFLSLLEESGYMARAAFITDRLMRAAGLSGRSFIPALIGLGCTTHAVTASRALDSRRDKRLTIMLLPFISCAARLPVYGLFAGTFFAAHRQLVVIFLYLLGIFIGGTVGVILSRTLFREGEAPFVMELPAYRLPAPSVVLSRVWERLADFTARAGSLILFMSILLWFLQSVGRDFLPVRDSSQSLFAALGSALAPFLAPLGFGHWRAGVALLSGVVAKEAIVSSLSVLYAAPLSGLPDALAASFTPASALSFLVFCLLYAPCLSAIAAIYRELCSLRWTLLTLCLHLGIAYAVSFFVYRLALIFL